MKELKSDWSEFAYAFIIICQDFIYTENATEKVSM